MDTKTGAIRSLTPQEPLRPTEVEITEAEKREMEIHPGPERMAALERFRTEARTEAKPRTKRDKTSGMPRHTRRNGDNPNRGQKKGRRG